ncbi:MAG: hypothetical protein EBU01_06865 [Crocinitomicaceae bacterium]|nr:hypothetical protein [Crocinitomicaceae bacterium]
MPFGANLLPVSLGFLTIYPNFILTFCLLPIAFLSFKKWNKLEISVLGFLFCWLLFSIFQGQNSGFPKEAIFDIRSLLMQFIFAVALISVYHFIEATEATISHATLSTLAAPVFDPVTSRKASSRESGST